MVVQDEDDILTTLAGLETEGELPDVDQVEGHGFEGLSGGIVRANQALDIVQNPDAFRLYEYEGTQFLLATRRVDRGRVPFVQLAVAVTREGWRVTGAFRMRVEDADELARLAQ